jgi:hypothetical protein
MVDEITAIRVIEPLRMGIPPQKGVELYAVGNEELIKEIKNRFLCKITYNGFIRFINGSWGAGKTHFFRQLREVSFQNDCLVSNVELGVDIAALNKFESIFSAIIRQISTPSIYSEETSVAPFGVVLQESLAWLSNNNRIIPNEISHELFSIASKKLTTCKGIDIDFKKIVIKYWETFLPENSELEIIQQTREEILQWFSGEGNIVEYRNRFGVKKLVSKNNAKIMLESLAAFIKLSGYKGLVILFDEAEQAYSVMRKAALRKAHDNLLTLINNIEELRGLFLIYATTPDFFNNREHGIIIYAALAQRIGRLKESPPNALDRIWNFDSIEQKLDDYQEAAKKILAIYKIAYPDKKEELPSDDDISTKVMELLNKHPPLASIRFWRLLVTAIVEYLDNYSLEKPLETEKLYMNIMERLREG